MSSLSGDPAQEEVKMACKCQDCGTLYRVDILVPDDLWEKIRPDKERDPEAGLLCGPCIMRRIEEREEYGAFSLFHN